MCSIRFNLMKPLFTFLLISIAIPLFAARTVIEKAGTYELTSTDEGITINGNIINGLTVNLSKSTNKNVTLRFSTTSANYLLKGAYDSNDKSDVALLVIDGNVTLEVPKDVTARLAPETRKNTANTDYYGAAINLGANATLTLSGQGRLLIYGHNGESPITKRTSSAANSGALIIKDEIDVYLSAEDDVPAISNLASITINGGRVYCVPKHTLPGATYLPTQTPTSQWNGKSALPPLQAANVHLAGGALLGSPSTLTTYATPANAITYSGAIENFTHTGGAYLTLNANVINLPAGMTSLPGACIAFNENTPCSGTFFSATNARAVFLPSTAHYLYQSPKMEAAVTIFALSPTPTETGMTVDYDFGILGIKPYRNEQNTVIQLTVGVRLPNITGLSTPAFNLTVTESQDGETLNAYVQEEVTFTRTALTDELFTVDIITPFDFNASYLGARTYNVKVSNTTQSTTEE